MIGIYKITNPNCKIYIGQSINIEKRFDRYKKGDCIAQYALFSSLIKYGWVNHNFEILEECNISQLDTRERYYQNLYNVLGENGLNCIIIGSDGVKQIYSAESIEKMSDKAKKRTISEARKSHQSKMLKGIKHTDEHKLKISLANKGKDHWWHKGKPTSDYQKLQAKLHNQKTICQYSKDGKFIKEWDSVKSVADYYGISGSSVSDCARSKNKSAIGFIWKYL